MAATVANKGPDMEIKQAFVELQMKMVETNKEMKMADWKGKIIVLLLQCFSPFFLFKIYS